MCFKSSTDYFWVGSEAYIYWKAAKEMPWINYRNIYLKISSVNRNGTGLTNDCWYLFIYLLVCLFIYVYIYKQMKLSSELMSKVCVHVLCVYIICATIKKISICHVLVFPLLNENRKVGVDGEDHPWNLVPWIPG